MTCVVMMHALMCMAMCVAVAPASLSLSLAGLRLTAKAAAWHLHHTHGNLAVTMHAMICHAVMIHAMVHPYLVVKQSHSGCRDMHAPSGMRELSPFCDSTCCAAPPATALLDAQGYLVRPLICVEALISAALSCCPKQVWAHEQQQWWHCPVSEALS